MKKNLFAMQIFTRRESKKKLTTLRNERGFSLIELLIVMVILGLLASLVGPRMFGKLGKAKTQTAKTQIEMLGAALDAFRLDVGMYPEDLGGLVNQADGLEAWSGPYLAKGTLPKDPWGHDYIYEYPGQNGEYDLYSYGADGQPGGEGENADIVSWE